MSIERTRSYAKFTLVKEPWMPEIRSGISRKALKNDISKNGLQEPIVADFNGKVFAGRTRFEICKELKVDLLVRRMSTDKAKQYAMSDRLQRDLTVLDRVRIVQWVQQELLNQAMKGDMRNNISRALQNQWGWTTGSSEAQIQKYQEVIAHREKSRNQAKVDIRLRDAPHLHEAWSNLCHKKASKASSKSRSSSESKFTSSPDILGKLKGVLKKIGTDPARLTKDELVGFVEKIRTLVEPTPKRMPKKG
jgi:ParB-like chromosome segregation protein Spo0J